MPFQLTFGRAQPVGRDETFGRAQPVGRDEKQLSKCEDSHDPIEVTLNESFEYEYMDSLLGKFWAAVGLCNFRQRTLPTPAWPASSRGSLGMEVSRCFHEWGPLNSNGWCWDGQVYP